MEDRMIYVPYGDFIDGVKALADLDSIRAMVVNDSAYCSDNIKGILGIPTEEELKRNAGND